MRLGTLLFLTTSLLISADWPMFRGPNGSGISQEKNLPLEFGPNKNLVWKTPLPAGHSSPVLIGDRIYLTGFDEENIFTFALDRQSGRILWRRPAPAQGDPAQVEFAGLALGDRRREEYLRFLH
jgi:outer membrane protein assembly factor BamB